MNIYRKSANFLTLLRLALGLPLVLLLSTENYVIAWLLFLFAGLSDFLDGKLARKARDGKNEWGARFDPLADKFLLAAPILWLVFNQMLSIWMVWILFVRELYISNWRSNDKEGAPASMGGKIKTLLQFTSILMMLWPLNWGNSDVSTLIHFIGLILFWISFFIAIISGLKYLSD